MSETPVSATKETLKESPSQATKAYLSLDPSIVRSAIIGETIVFCTLALLGGGLFALVAITNVNWYYPTVFYGVVVYIAWQRYFSVSVTAESVAQPAQASQATAATQIAKAAADQATASARATSVAAQLAETAAELANVGPLEAPADKPAEESARGPGAHSAP